MKYMSKDVIKQLFEVFNDIYDNAEKEHDMLIVSHSKSEWIAVNFGVSQRTAQRWIAEHKEKQVLDKVREKRWKLNESFSPRRRGR